jgi:CheY-like chemotaxis protein
MTDGQRTVLVIEDIANAFTNVRQTLENDGWKVLRAKDEPSVWQHLERGQGEPQIDAVVLDLGLSPYPDDPMRSGLPLARKLRAKAPELPIMAYTQLSLATEGIDFGLLLAKFLPLRISLIYMRSLPENVTLSEILERVWQGFVIVSPGVAEQLHYSVAARPDPLSTDLWDTLRLYSLGLSDQQIANKLPGIGVYGVRARRRTIIELLQKAGELEDYQTTGEDLIRWYRANYARYCRD